MHEFREEQIKAWDHWQKQHGRIQDSMSLADDLIPALRAAEVTADQLYPLCELVPCATKAVGHLAKQRAERIEELTTAITSAVTSLLDAARLKPMDLFEVGDLADWALANRFIADPKQRDEV